MISWMQKHKKYLVITIWISTIAFVGAGFVGWGAYKFGSAGDTVAEVGDIKVTLKELQNRYSTLYNYYNNLLGGKLDQQKAKEMGLEKLALNDLIKESLLLNYAQQIGLLVTDEEVANYIANMDLFKVNGVFDKKRYITLLQQNRLKPKDFEASIKKELLLSKLKNALKPTLFDLEFDTVASAIFMGDKIEYKILSAQDINVTINNKELKTYYEQHKNDYLTPTYYKVGLISIDPNNIKDINETELKEFYQKHKLKYKDKDGKIMPFEKAKELAQKDFALKKAKKIALRKYIEFKKEKLKPQKVIQIIKQDPLFNEKLKSANIGSTLKPFIVNGKYYVLKLQNRILPKPKNFQEAFNEVKDDLLREKQTELLIQKAKKMVQNFHGIKTDGYICKDDINKIKRLDASDAAKFLKRLFVQENLKGFIQLDSQKIILYKILDQKLVIKKKINKNRTFVTENGQKLKTNIQEKSIIKKLQTIYPIKIYKGI